LSIFRKNNVRARHEMTLTERAESYFKQYRHDKESSVNKFLYLIEMISVNLVKQYKD